MNIYIHIYTHLVQLCSFIAIPSRKVAFWSKKKFSVKFIFVSKNDDHASGIWVKETSRR